MDFQCRKMKFQTLLATCSLLIVHQSFSVDMLIGKLVCLFCSNRHAGTFSPESTKTKMDFIFKNWANPGLFFNYFQSFQTNNIIFTTNQCEKMSCPSSIRRWDSNPRPLERESAPITTRPGLY